MSKRDGNFNDVIRVFFRGNILTIFMAFVNPFNFNFNHGKCIHSDNSWHVSCAFFFIERMISGDYFTLRMRETFFRLNSFFENRRSFYESMGTLLFDDSIIEIVLISW